MPLWWSIISCALIVSESQVPCASLASVTSNPSWLALRVVAFIQCSVWLPAMTRFWMSLFFNTSSNFVSWKESGVHFERRYPFLQEWRTNGFAKSRCLLQGRRRYAAHKWREHRLNALFLINDCKFSSNCSLWWTGLAGSNISFWASTINKAVFGIGHSPLQLVFSLIL